MIGNRNRKDGKPRAIIVKFTRYATRNKIYSNKKKLKGKNLTSNVSTLSFVKRSPRKVWRKECLDSV